MSQSESQIAFGNADVAKLAKGAGITLVGRMAGRSMQVLGQIVIARLLGPATFGLYAIGWTILSMLGLIAPLGLGQGVIRYGSRYRHAEPGRFKSVLFQSVGMALLSGLLLGGCLYSAAPWLAEHVFKKPDLLSVLRWFSLALSLAAGLTVATAATTISQRMQYAVYTGFIVQATVSLFLFIVSYLMGWGLLGAVAADVMAFAIALILAVYYVRRLFPEVFSRQIKQSLVVKELLTFSMPASFAGVFTTLIFWADRLLVGCFRPAAEVGIYQAASQSSTLFVIIGASFSAIFSPMIADLCHRGSMEQVDELFKVSTKWALYLGLPFFLVMSLAPQELLTVVFGNQYESGALPVAILAIGQLINAGTGPVGPLLVMTGHQKQWALTSGVMLFTNIALNWLLTPRLGLPGAALGTACAMGGLSLFGLLHARRSLRVWPYDKRYIKGLLAAALAAGAMVFLRLAEIASPVLNLSVMLFTSVGMFGAVLLLLGLDVEDREFISLIQARLRSARERALEHGQRQN